MEAKVDIYIPGQNMPRSAYALIESLRELDLGKSYSEMMRLRASGGAADECKDIYYICTDKTGALASRLWMGWGRHSGAVGNWGNFFTSECFRGQGLGRQMITAWLNDLSSHTDLPLALFCTASERHTAFYSQFGWRCAIKGANSGPLYFPIGDSPETFEEFCREYYRPAKSLVFKPAKTEWRHEIDCLFKFAMLCEGKDYLPEGIDSLETALLKNDRRAEIIFTDQNIPVGLSYLQDNGNKDIRIYPIYQNLISI